MYGYLPRRFKLQELVPQTVFENAPAASLWKIFDPNLLWVIDWLRDTYGKMICNTWSWDGRHQYRGYRPPDCKVGATWSMHRFGRAFDLIPLDTTVASIHADIRANPDHPVFNRIRRVENVNWLHIDTANSPGATRTYFFNP